jgi:response regulator RpfG family c-di-GMP phosphodiesterase
LRSSGSHWRSASRSRRDYLARPIGLAVEELDALRLAGELHDIGKVAIPDARSSAP